MFWWYWLLNEDNKVNKVSKVTTENKPSLISDIVFIVSAFVFVIFLLAIFFM